MNLQGKSKFFYHIWFGRIPCVFYIYAFTCFSETWLEVVGGVAVVFVCFILWLVEVSLSTTHLTFRNDLNTTTLRAFDYTSFSNFVLWNPPTAKAQGVLWPRAVLETHYSRAIWILFWRIWALVIWTHRLKLCIYQCEWKILIIQKLW